MGRRVNRIERGRGGEREREIEKRRERKRNGIRETGKENVKIRTHSVY